MKDSCDKKDCAYWRDTPLGDSHHKCVTCRHSAWLPKSDKDNYKPNATGERPETRSDDRTQIVVRLRRSYWHDNDGAYQRTSLRYLKRHTKGFNFFDEDCSMVGTEDVIPKIVNLAKCEDGVYLLVMCNAHRDWETGHVEDWDYQLLPFSPNARISGGTPSTESDCSAGGDA